MRGTVRLRPVFVSLLVVTTACVRFVEDTATTTETSLITPTTVTTLPPVTTIPPTTTTVSLPPVSAYGVDVEWFTDLETDSIEYQAIDRGLRASLASGFEGPSSIKIVAYRDFESLLGVYAYVSGGTPEEVRQEWEDVQGRAYTNGDSSLIFISVDQPADDWFRRALVWVTAHEWYHLHEYVLTPGQSAGAQDDASAPMWLSEGAADWFAYDTMIRAGERPLDDTHRDGLDYRLDPFPGLGAWESRDGFTSDGGAYDGSHGAVDLLIEQVGADIVLDGYWHGRGGYEGSWRDVFAYAFQMTAEEFYVVVDDYMANR